MKIIIFGANEIGAMIATQFCATNDITIIDDEKNKLDVFNKLDISFVDGNATNIDTLKQANTKEADVFNNKISTKSPIAMAIMGKKVGDVATVKCDAGDYDVKVVDIKIAQ